jgi:hypothetical protein
VNELSLLSFNPTVAGSINLFAVIYGTHRKLECFSKERKPRRIDLGDTGYYPNSATLRKIGT